MGKAIGLDYGTKRIGVAISDESRTFAREIGIWPAAEFYPHLQDFLAKNDDIDSIAVGLPLNMSGEDTTKTQEARSFAQEVQTRTGIETVLVDERLTSSMARSLPGGKHDVDSLAAQLILQTYLDQNKT